MLKIGIKKRNKEILDSWNKLNEKYGCPFVDGESYRLWVKNKVSRGYTYRDNSNESNFKEAENSFKETVEIDNDGIQRSSRIIKMSEKDKKSPEFIMNAHGYDPNEWELVNAKHSIWTGYSKKDGQFPQYASKITVRPMNSLLSIDDLIKVIKDNTIGTKRSISPKKIDQDNRRLLEVPIYDAHFGVSTFDDYADSQSNILDYIQMRHWDKIIFTIGSDNFHNDDFRGRTSKGTEIERVDMVKSWRDAILFYIPLIESAIQKSNSVKIIYVKGNHDESMSWAFVQYLKARYPNLKFDDDFEERKAILYGLNFIGFTHGDKAKKNLHNIFAIEFPEMWAKAKNREVHIGHIHREEVLDNFGTVVRVLSTKNKTDKWHRDNGFVGPHKRFMIFDYSLDNLKSIYYV